MYLLDTNVISELRKKGTPRADQNVVRWEQSVPPHLCSISVMTVFELELGILRLERHDLEQGAILRQWLETQVLPAFLGRILHIDLPVIRRAAALHVPNARPDRDAVIAATALARRLTVVTRNSRDFDGLNITLINPWEDH